MFTKLLVHLLGNTLLFYMLDLLLTYLTIEGGWKGYIVAGCCLGLVNLFIKPLLKIAAFPFKFFTMGLIFWVVQIILVALVVFIVNTIAFEGVHVTIEGWQGYIIVSIVFTLLNGIIHALEKIVTPKRK